MSRIASHHASGIAAAMIFAASGIAHAGDVSVSVNVNTPGVYGQITIGGGLPAPELLMQRPVVAVAPPRVVVGVPVAPPAEPLYLHVPPGHEKHWAKHCREYHACGRPVYFVSDRWYREVYTPHRREHPEWRENHEDHDQGHGHGHGHDHHDRGDRDRG